MSKTRQGFTLIELLVVVTIIVVLLALLVPAMDKALAQAQMALCGANMKGVASAATTYATGNARSYPHRKAINASGQPQQLNDPWTGGGTPQATDDRIVMKDYVHLDSFRDPMCDDLPMDPSETNPRAKNAAQNTPEPFVYSGYYLFYGWQYTDTAANKGLKKLGDNGFSWTGANNLFNKSGSWTFNVMVADQNAMTRALNGFASSHPDKTGVMPLQTLNNEVGLPVTFHRSTEWAETLSFEVRPGIRLGLAHGHQASSPDQIKTWWAKMSHAGVLDVDVLLTGHFHFASLRPSGRDHTTGRARWHIQAPTLDNGSAWVTNKYGSDGDPALAVFAINDAGFDVQSFRLL